MSAVADARLLRARCPPGTRLQAPIASEASSEIAADGRLAAVPPARVGLYESIRDRSIRRGVGERCASGLTGCATCRLRLAPHCKNKLRLKSCQPQAHCRYIEARLMSTVVSRAVKPPPLCSSAVHRSAPGHLRLSHECLLLERAPVPVGLRTQPGLCAG